MGFMVIIDILITLFLVINIYIFNRNFEYLEKELKDLSHKINLLEDRTKYYVWYKNEKE